MTRFSGVAGRSGTEPPAAKANINWMFEATEPAWPVWTAYG
jgi:hypothetical protein